MVLKKAQEDLAKLQIEYARIKEQRRPTKDIQDKINEQKKAIDLLIIKAETFDNDVNKKIEELLKKSNGDVQKALDLLKGTKSTGYISGFLNWAGYSSREDVALTDSIDKEVEKRLQEKLENLKKNDPINNAIARLNGATPADAPKALEGVVVAMLGKLGITMDKLDLPTRQKLAGHLSNTSHQKVALQA